MFSQNNRNMEWPFLFYGTHCRLDQVDRQLKNISLLTKDPKVICHWLKWSQNNSSLEKTIRHWINNRGVLDDWVVNKRIMKGLALERYLNNYKSSGDTGMLLVFTCCSVAALLHTSIAATSLPPSSSLVGPNRVLSWCSSSSCTSVRTCVSPFGHSQTLLSQHAADIRWLVAHLRMMEMHVSYTCCVSVVACERLKANLLHAQLMGVDHTIIWFLVFPSFCQNRFKTKQLERMVCRTIQLFHKHKTERKKQWCHTICTTYVHSMVWSYIYMHPFTLKSRSAGW